MPRPNGRGFFADGMRQKGQLEDFKPRKASRCRAGDGPDDCDHAIPPGRRVAFVCLEAAWRDRSPSLALRPESCCSFWPTARTRTFACRIGLEQNGAA